MNIVEKYKKNLLAAIQIGEIPAETDWQYLVSLLSVLADDTGKVLLTKEQDHIAEKIARIAWSVFNFDNDPDDKSDPCHAANWETLLGKIKCALRGRTKPTPDNTGKVLLTKDQWEEAQRDKARLDWLEQHAVVIGLSLLAYVEIDATRVAIDAARADTKGTST